MKTAEICHILAQSVRPTSPLFTSVRSGLDGLGRGRSTAFEKPLDNGLAEEGPMAAIADAVIARREQDGLADTPVTNPE